MISGNICPHLAHRGGTLAERSALSPLGEITANAQGAMHFKQTIDILSLDDVVIIVLSLVTKWYQDCILLDERDMVLYMSLSVFN